MSAPGYITLWEKWRSISCLSGRADSRIPFLRKFASLPRRRNTLGWKRSFSSGRIGAPGYAGLHIYRINVAPLVAQSPSAPPGGLTVRIVPREELLKAAGDADLDWDLDSFRDALARGDIAFGALRAVALMPTRGATFTAAPIGWPVGEVHHPYQYSYKAFTRPSHRRSDHVAITAFADTYLPGARLPRSKWVPPK